VTIEEQPNGRYKVTVYRGRDPQTGKPDRFCRTVDTLRAAEKLEANMKRKPATRGRTRTVADAVQIYIDLNGGEGGTLRPNTENSYRGLYRAHIENTELGQLPLASLDRDALTWYFSQLRNGSLRPGARRLAHNSVRNVRALLSAAMNEAVASGWLDSNPVDAVRLRSEEPAPRAMDDYSLADVAKVLAACDDDLRELAQLAIATGARQGEIAGLRWSDISLEHGLVIWSPLPTIGHARKPATGWVRQAAKGKRRRRREPVFVDDACVAMLKARHARHAADALRAGVSDLDARAVASQTLELDYTNPNVISQRWRQAAKAAGVSIRFHDLRHLNASEMSAANVPTQIAIARNGWNSADMYHGNYGHKRADMADPAVAVLGALWSKLDELTKGQTA